MLINILSFILPALISIILSDVIPKILTLVKKAIMKSDNVIWYSVGKKELNTEVDKIFIKYSIEKSSNFYKCLMIMQQNNLDGNKLNTLSWEAIRTHQEIIIMNHMQLLIKNKELILTKQNEDKALLTNTQTLTLKLLREKANYNVTSYIYGFLTLGVVLAYFIASYFIAIPKISPYIILFSSLFIFLCFSKQKVFEYRVKKGFYGTCYAEARELICYIIDNNKKDDGNTGKPIFLDEEVETYARSIVNGVREYNV